MEMFKLEFKDEEELLNFLNEKYKPKLVALNAGARFTIHEGAPGYDPNGIIPFEIKTKIGNSTGTFVFDLKLDTGEEEINNKFKEKMIEIQNWIEGKRSI